MTIDSLIEGALAEDLPNGDLTTDRLDLSGQKGRGLLIAKEDLVLSGCTVFEKVFQKMDPTIKIRWHAKDGEFVWKGQTLAIIDGPLSALLKAERTALNFLGRLSGVATLTRCFVQQVEHTGCKILDTRKTTPLLRELEKAAVRHGGGHNHRLNLSASVLIKDNHIQAAGGITQAIRQILKHGSVPIEVECETLAQIEEAARLPVHWIMLDNFSDDILKSALTLVPRQISTEASGNMKLDRVKRVAEMGVTAISVGALTHSAPTADLSLEFEI